MIIQEIVTINNRKFKHTYSDQNKYIKQEETGAIYDEAYDISIRDFHYTETETEIEKIEFEDVPQTV